MPIYGEAKTRNMARSVLPSTRARSARDELAAIKRKNRRRVRQHLSRAVTQPVNSVPGRYALEDTPAHDWDPWDEEAQDHALEYYPDKSIGYAVRDRRSGDKLGPIQRWAPAISAHLEPSERYAYVAARLPKNLIGWHALTHLAYTDGIALDYEHRHHYTSYHTYADEHARRCEIVREAAIAFYTELCLEGGQRCLPRADADSGFGVPLPANVGEVEAFVGEVTSPLAYARSLLAVVNLYERITHRRTCYPSELRTLRRTPGRWGTLTIAGWPR
jgi:hypothetical protein